MLAMDGYAGYLWVAYGVTALVVMGNLLAARRQFRRTRQRLREQLERRGGRRPVHVIQSPGETGGDKGDNEAMVGRDT